MENAKAWGEKLKEFRLKVGCNYQGDFVERLSRLEIGIDIPSYEISRYESGNRIPKDRSRHLEMIEGLVKLGGIQTLEEANHWLALGGQGYLTQEEAEDIFDQDEGIIPEQQRQISSRGEYFSELSTGRWSSANVGATQKAIVRSLTQISGLLFFALCLVVTVGLGLIGFYTEKSRNEPIGLLATENCQPPPSQIEACPLQNSEAVVRFPLSVTKCQEIQNNYFMKTTAELTEKGELKAKTEILSDRYLFGFTGRATIYFCNGHETIDWITNRWGVNGRLIPPAPSHRIENWSCPKNPSSIRGVCSEGDAFSNNFVSKDTLEQITYLNIVQERDSTKFNKRLQNTVQDFEQFLSAFFD